MVRRQKPVQGFLFRPSGGTYEDRSNTICQIIGREESDESLVHGPMFVVRFGDGTEMVVFGDELTPWFQTD